MQNNKIEKLIIAILVVIALTFLGLWRLTAYVCADALGETCTPTLPIPSREYLPEVTPTPSPTPSYAPSPTFLPSVTPIQPTISPTPVAGSSASVAMPSFAPDTSLRQY